MAEREGFEPSVPFWSTHALQACTFDHSVISPKSEPEKRTARPDPLWDRLTQAASEARAEARPSRAARRSRAKRVGPQGRPQDVAEREGFEPSVHLLDIHTLSR